MMMCNLLCDLLFFYSRTQPVKSNKKNDVQFLLMSNRRHHQASKQQHWSSENILSFSNWSSALRCNCATGYLQIMWFSNGVWYEVRLLIKQPTGNMSGPLSSQAPFKNIVLLHITRKEHREWWLKSFRYWCSHCEHPAARLINRLLNTEMSPQRI